MVGEKAKKAEQELAWRDSRVFAQSFEKWLDGKTGKIVYFDGGKRIDLFSLFTDKEKEWLLKSYGKIKKDEKRIFFKTLIYFMCLLGTKKVGCKNLAKVLKKMATDDARLGEFYEYLVQYAERKVEYRGIRFSSLVSIMQKESNIEKEYYKWFSKEFHLPPEGKCPEHPDFFTTKTPKEFIEMRKNAKWKPLSSILSSIEGIYVGNAVLGKIKNYVEHGGITKLSFEGTERAARVANLLFEFGLQDISQSSNKITLGLKETIYEARKKIEEAPSFPREEYLMESYLDYFKAHGLDTVHINEISYLFNSGKEIEAVDKMCRLMVQACKKQYLIMGEKKYSFGKEGLRMVSEFKKYVGEEGHASLLLLYDMVSKRDYSSALKRLKTICDAMDDIRGDYPHMFSP